MRINKSMMSNNNKGTYYGSTRNKYYNKSNNTR